MGSNYNGLGKGQKVFKKQESICASLYILPRYENIPKGFFAYEKSAVITADFLDTLFYIIAYTVLSIPPFLVYKI